MNDRVSRLRKDIEWAIQNGLSLHINYRDQAGDLTQRKISPKNWVSPDIINAYCYLEGSDRRFHLDNIVEYRFINREKDQALFSMSDNHEDHTFKSPPEAQLVEVPIEGSENHEQLRGRLDTLEQLLAEKELELATLEAKLITFERRYIRIVGRYVAELDRLEADIAELYLRLNPEKPEAHYQAETAREQAEKSEEEVRSAEEADRKKTSFPSSEKIKSIYRELCKKVHPDLTVDPAEKERRTEIMAEVNKAFREGNASLLRTMLDDYKLFDSDEDFRKAKINHLKRKIKQTMKRLGQIREKMIRLEYSELYRLMKRVEEAEADGMDLLSLMAEEVKEKIRERRHTLELLQQELTSE